MSRKLWFDFKKKMCNALHFSIPYISKKSPIVTKTKKVPLGSHTAIKVGINMLQSC